MRWLMATESPWPLAHGVALRVWHFARKLTEGGDQVTLLTPKVGQDCLGAYRSIGVSLLQAAVDGPVKRPGRWSMRAYSFTSVVAKALTDNAGKFDVTVLVNVTMLQYASYVAACPVVVADIIDDPVLAVRRSKRGGRLLRTARKMRRLVELRLYERRFLPLVTVASLVTEQDAASFRGRNKGTHVIVSPNGVDLEWYAPAPNAAHDADVEPIVIFVGNMSFAPNHAAAKFLIQEIATIVWRDHPVVRFQLVGPDVPDDVRQLAGPRVEVIGWVEDIRPYLARASVVTVPMLTGTGVKNKLMEAWASAKAVVATPLACQGLPAQHGQNIMVGRGAKELAACIVDLIGHNQLRRSIETEARRSIEQGYSWTATVAQFRQAVLAAQGPRGD